MRHPLLPTLLASLLCTAVACEDDEDAHGVSLDSAVDNQADTSHLDTSHLADAADATPDSGTEFDAAPPINACGRETCQAGCSTGDPHLLTLDGAYYDFQSAGEFWLVRDDAGFGIQVRQQHAGTCAGVAYNTAVAFQAGDLKITITRDAQNFVLISDGRRFPQSDNLDLALSGLRLSWACEALKITWASGDVLWIDLFSGSSLNLQYIPSASRAGALEGLFGDYDGAPEQDLSLPDGTALETLNETQFTTFSEGWQITEGESLFVYEPEEGPETYRGVAWFGEIDLSHADQARVDLANQACALAPESLKSSCMVDVVCGNLSPEEAAAWFVAAEPPSLFVPLELPTPPDGCYKMAAEFFDGEGAMPGMTYQHFCPSGCGQSGAVWGTDIYTDDSNLCQAAVHAGLLALDESGEVSFRELPGQDLYVGTTRNGITSSDYGSWARSFEFVPDL